MFYTLSHIVLNAIGGSLRWIYGSIWRTIFKKPKYQFKEYLHGPTKSKDHWDKQQHFTNGFVAIIFLAVITYILV